MERKREKPKKKEDFGRRKGREKTAKALKYRVHE